MIDLYHEVVIPGSELLCRHIQFLITTIINVSIKGSRGLHWLSDFAAIPVSKQALGDSEEERLPAFSTFFLFCFNTSR